MRAIVDHHETHHEIGHGFDHETGQCLPRTGGRHALPTPTPVVIPIIPIIPIITVTVVVLIVIVIVICVLRAV